MSRTSNPRRLLAALTLVAAATLAACGGPAPDPVAEPAAHEQGGAATTGTGRPAHPSSSGGDQTGDQTGDQAGDQAGSPAGDDPQTSDPGQTGDQSAQPSDAPSGEDPAWGSPSPSGTTAPSTSPTAGAGTGSQKPTSGPTSHVVLPQVGRLSNCPSPAKAVQHSAGRRGKTVALTFDDGPSPTSTAKVLAVLDRHHVHATFFVVGLHAAQYPGLLRKIEAQGSMLGNHSWSHPLPHTGGRFDTLPLPDEYSQIDRTQAAVAAAVGHKPCFFRAPGGMDKTPQSLAAARSRGLSVINWDIDTRDWAAPHRPDLKAQASIRAIATGHAAGGRTQPIILFHDGAPGVYRGNMLSVLDQVITWYQQRGYTFTDPLGRAF